MCIRDRVNASVGSAGGSSEFLNRFSNETDKQGKSSTSLKNSNDVALQNKDSVSSNFVAPPASKTLILEMWIRDRSGISGVGIVFIL